MMRVSYLAIVLSCFALVSHAAQPLVNKETGITFPESLAGLALGDARPYEEVAGQPGVAIPYRGRTAAVTVFVRHLDAAKPMTAKELLTENISALKRLADSGAYSLVKVMTRDDDPAPQGWSSAAVLAVKDDARLVSIILVTVRGQYAIKARITTPNPKDEVIAKFMTDFQDLVDKKS